MITASQGWQVGWGVGGGAGLTTQPPHVNHPPANQSHASHHVPSLTSPKPPFFGPTTAGTKRVPTACHPCFPIALQRWEKRAGGSRTKDATERPLGHVPRLRGKPQKADLAFYVVVSCEVCASHIRPALSVATGAFGVSSQPAGVT